MTLQEYIAPIVYERSFKSVSPNTLELCKVILTSLGSSFANFSQEINLDTSVVKIFSENKDQFQKVDLLFKRLNLKDLVVRKKTLKPNDWLTRWKQQWKPAPLTKYLDVVPVWCKNKYRIKRGRDFILMDTLLSFGTGLHETTQIMAQFIEDQKNNFKSFLDIGTGTGILAMVALKYGANPVLAIDIGDLSVQAAKDNLKVNGLNAAVKKADIKKFKHTICYDFVAANLITHDLIANAEQLQRAYRTLSLKCLNVQKGKQWSGLLFQKKMS